MALSDYEVKRDKFEIDEVKAGLCFPCNVCVHNNNSDKDYPCVICGHNVNAEKDENDS